MPIVGVSYQAEERGSKVVRKNVAKITPKIYDDRNQDTKRSTKQQKKLITLWYYCLLVRFPKA